MRQIVALGFSPKGQAFYFCSLINDVFAVAMIREGFSARAPSFIARIRSNQLPVSPRILRPRFFRRAIPPDSPAIGETNARGANALADEPKSGEETEGYFYARRRFHVARALSGCCGAS